MFFINQCTVLTFCKVRHLNEKKSTLVKLINIALCYNSRQKDEVSCRRVKFPLEKN